MIDLLNNGDILITNSKKNILEELEKNKKIINIRFMTLKEFIDSYYGKYNEKTLYYLIKKYNYKYDVAKMYLDNFIFDEKLKQELDKENLIDYEPLFRKSIKRIVTDIKLDPYLEKELKKYELVYFEKEKKSYINSIYEAKDIEEEVNFVAIKILKLLENNKIENIFIVKPNFEYYEPIKKIFKFYNIPFNLEKNKKIYGYKQTKAFIERLKETKNIEDALEVVTNIDIYNAIIDVCNKYRFTFVDKIIIDLIIEELKRKEIKNSLLKYAINFVDIEEIKLDKYYFILGFNQGLIPKTYKDEDYLSDKQKKELGIFTSLDKNLLEKEKITKVIFSNPNIYISYKLRGKKEEYYPSTLITDLDLEVKKIKNNIYNYSNIYNKINLTRKLDQFIKFNDYDEDIGLLYYNYQDLPYLKYDNKYQEIDKDLFLKYFDKRILSYSSLDNYYRCGFRYYLNNVLKLNKYEETFMTLVGNLFHYILSVAFKDNFDFEKEFKNYLKDYNLSSKEKFFIEKLKKELIYTIDIIKNQDLDTSLNDALYEEKIFVNEADIPFMGIIDKLKYKEMDNKTLVAIIDYKTGKPNINLSNLEFGIDMQLPIYIYLARRSKLKNVELLGFYLQKIIHEDKKDKEKLYRLEGYTNSDLNNISYLDKNYKNSNIIKGLKIKEDGNFYANSKIITNTDIEKIDNVVEEKIKEASKKILNRDFKINPKRINGQLVGCLYCKYKNICFQKEEDVVDLECSGDLDE